MSAKAKWVGVDLWNLLNLPLAELVKLYPEEKKNTLKGKKAYWKHKVLNGETQMPPSPEATQPNPERETYTEEIIDGNVVSSIQGWYEVVTKDNEGEAHVHRLHKSSTKVRPTVESLAEQFVPATPARITPSRRKPVDLGYDNIFVFSDVQAGDRHIFNPRTGEYEKVTLHDPRAMRVARLICRDAHPKLIVNNGDTADFSSISRFKKDSNHFMNEMGPTFQTIHNMYAEYRADNPDARIVEVASNHNQRLTDWTLQNFPQMHNVYQAGSNSKYPVLSYPFLTNLEHVNVEWLGGYPAGELVYGEEYDKPPIVFRHGTENSQNGTTASKIMKNHPETHNVHGHDHTQGESWHTTRNGNTLGNFVVGALCRTTGEVPGYHTAIGDDNKPVHYQENWQQSVMIIRDYRNGEYEFIQIPIKDGVARYNGKEYRADES